MIKMLAISANKFAWAAAIKLKDAIHNNYPKIQNIERKNTPFIYSLFLKLH